MPPAAAAEGVRIAQAPRRDGTTNETGTAARAQRS
jgi:hypothetical protein